MKHSPTRRKTSPVAAPRETREGHADPVAAARAAAFVTDDPAAALEHFRPLAAGVSTVDLTPLNGAPLVMLANVKSALATLEPHLGDVAARLSGARLTEVFELPTLVLALDAAAARVPSRSLSSGEIEKLLAEGRPLRELSLSYFEIVSHPLFAIVPAERVRSIRAGHGKVDTSRDFVALAALFTEFREAIEGRHPFTEAMVACLAELGATLLQQVRPGGASAPEKKRGDESVLRDQLAALVEDRYDHLLVLASVALGRRKADALLPALRSASYPATPEKKPEAKPAGETEAKGEETGEVKAQG